jgi:hypothetical protein
VKRALAWYALAVLLVVAYVNTFVLWRGLRADFGDGAALAPWLLVGVLALGVAALWRFGPRRTAMVPTLLGAASIVAVAGMLLADPGFPAKRMHVPQYAMLGCVVWAALRPHVGGDRLVSATVLIGGLFGIHDEFLQGLHPDRTFGLRDMAVNLCGVAAGALALAGLTGRPLARGRALRSPALVLVCIAMAATGLALYLVAMAGLPVRPLPYWPAVPLLAGSFALASALARRDTEPDVRHVGTVAVVQLLVLAVYPVIANESPLHFA